MERSAVVFEQGITYGYAPNTVTLWSPPADTLSCVPLVRAKYQVAPIAYFRGFAIEGEPSLHDVEESLFNLEGKLLDPKFEHPRGMLEDSETCLCDLEYEVLGAIHHCIQMSRRYNEACHEIAVIANAGRDKGGGISLQWEEVHYELDAVISKCTRALDRIGDLIWVSTQRRGPRDIRKICRTKLATLPEPVRVAVELFSEAKINEIIDYRDSIHHFAGNASPMLNIKAKRVSKSVWTARAMMPDDPRERSASKISCNERRDALGYCWRTINELYLLSSSVARNCAITNPVPHCDAGANEPRGEAGG